MENEKRLSAALSQQLLQTLKMRFEANMPRHAGIQWAPVLQALESQAERLWSLNEMENTGGEPDVVLLGEKEAGVLFCDCSLESPLGRRNLCYDEKALKARKKNKPQGSAIDMAALMGIQLLSEAQYRALQNLGEFDTKTSSWVLTPVEIREKGGALFCDRRYNHVFTYHNGAESYYGVRGFRGVLLV